MENLFAGGKATAGSGDGRGSDNGGCGDFREQGLMERKTRGAANEKTLLIRALGVSRGRRALREREKTFAGANRRGATGAGAATAAAAAFREQELIERKNARRCERKGFREKGAADLKEV